ncbi:MAG: hypothetical protein HKP58_08335 [Desulfatitalea sp.]|nr:hypothetical protein [Desulfatitalea sp.]NNK00408.1 hypothetical protein [Desulfatitalea sp.]
MKRQGTCLSLLGWMLLCLFGFGGCAGVPLPTRSSWMGEEGQLGGCAAFFAAQDDTALQAQVMDPGVFRVPGYPYLRVNRFLASFGNAVDSPEAFEVWVDRMQALDLEARRHEWVNLPGPPPSEAQSHQIHQRATICGEALREADFKWAWQRQKLKDAIAVPDEYIETRRVLGIYALTQWFVSRGVRDWHEEALRQFSTAPPEHRSPTKRYWPPGAVFEADATGRFAFVQPDALGIPVFSPDERAALFRSFAPVWEIDTRNDADRIGAPMWSADGRVMIDVGRTPVYLKLNYTHFGGRVLIQLNYIIWFPARPKTGVLDIYGGHLDGLNYRVTLDIDGSPLLYETMHNCGCYYKAYFTERLKVRQAIDYAEPPLMFPAPAVDAGAEVMVVSMQSRTHYVQHLYAAPREGATDTGYRLMDYNILRSLPLPDTGRRSMFRPDGIAFGSQRLERFVLWPTGVNSPGAMRQWGRHAVAFVGKRHFDDPFYMEKMFQRAVAADNSSLP